MTVSRRIVSLSMWVCGSRNDLPGIAQYVRRSQQTHKRKWLVAVKRLTLMLAEYNGSFEVYLLAARMTGIGAQS